MEEVHQQAHMETITNGDEQLLMLIQQKQLDDLMTDEHQNDGQQSSKFSYVGNDIMYQHQENGTLC